MSTEADTQYSLPHSRPTAAAPRRAWLPGLILVLILIVGTYFRFVGLNWDDFTHLHPDERFLTGVSARMQATYNPLEYLRTTESPINPYNPYQPGVGFQGEGFYVYGNFPMTVTRMVGEWAERLRAFCPEGSEALFCTQVLTSYDGIHLVGRALSGILDLIAVLFTFLIGRRLYGTLAGLIGAFLMATAVMPIQQSHFYTMDNWASALTTITFYCAVRAAESGQKLRWWGLFGLMLGLTVASRINVAPLALLAGVAALVWLGKRSQARSTRQAAAYLQQVWGRLDLQTAAIGVLLAAVISLLTFRLAMPYAFMDSQLAQDTYLQEFGQEPSGLRVFVETLVGFNPKWLANMEEIQRLQAPDVGLFPPAIQWTDRPAILFPLANMILYGMGPLAGILAWVGFLWALSRILRGRPDWLVHALPVAWVGVYFLFAATRWVKSIRYFLPIYPILFLLAGWLIAELWHKWQLAHPDKRGTWRQIGIGGWSIVALALVAMTTSFLWANAFVEIYRQPLTRVAAAEWIYDHVPSGATLLYTTADGEAEEKQLPLWGADLQAGLNDVEIRFPVEETMTVTGVRLNYVSDLDVAQAGAAIEEEGLISDSERILVGLNAPFGSGSAVAEAETAVGLTGEESALLFPFEPVTLPPGEEGRLFIRAGEGGGIRLSTSVLTSEHWDDSLPPRWNGIDPFSQYYRGPSQGQFASFGHDTPEKRADFYRIINEADYIIISSQRALWNVPRIPMTFPMMIEYYDALFNEELGFDLVAQFHGDMRIGPLYISDTSGQVSWGSPPNVGWPPPPEWAAEEAFSVYDHPPVWIFEKREEFQMQEVVARLDAVDLSNTVAIGPGEAEQTPNGLLLPNDVFEAQTSGGTFSEEFNVDGVLSTNSTAAAIAWWASVILLGWLTFPISFAAFRGLADRGYALSRILSILLISYFAWVGGSLNWFPHTRGTLLLGVLIILVISSLLIAWRGGEMRQFIRQRWRLLVAIELLGIGLYLFQILLRLGNPDVWHVIWGGEKPMDLSYFTAVLKSTSFPPYDPWFAGGYINYYYYGFVYVGVLTKLLGIVPTMAYNLILPLLFSFTGTGIFSLAFTLIRRVERDGEKPDSPFATFGKLWRSRGMGGGLLAVMLALVLGNLAQIRTLIDAWFKTGDAESFGSPIMRTLNGLWRIVSLDTTANIYPGDWFWSATRAISVPDGEVAPITEFPYFTFLYGDLHAHMIALPLTVLALGWAISLALSARTLTSSTKQPSSLYQVGMLLLGGLAIGVLYPTNSWDFPTYLVIGFLGLGLATWRRFGLTLTSGIRWLMQMVGLTAVSLFAFYPFWANFGTAYSSVRLWEGATTSVGDYLLIYGLFYLIIITYLTREFKLWAQTWTEKGLARFAPWMALVIGGLFVLVLAITLLYRLDYTIIWLALPLVLLAGVLSLIPSRPVGKRIVDGLIASAVALTVIVEMVVLDGDIGRMNTVFKFYLQVWVLLSVAAGAGFVWLLPTIDSWHRLRRTTWSSLLTVLFIAALLYPIFATRAKWMVRENREVAPLTLDGMQFMSYVQYGDSGQTINLSHDYEALLWMQQNIQGSPVVVEAHGSNPYRSIANRVAMYTGLPTIIGWDWHQRQQKSVLPGSVVSNRIQEVNAFYQNPDIENARQFIAKYDVEYIYVGTLEWAYYNPVGLNKFAEMEADGQLEEVYRNRGVSIYRVLPTQPQVN